MYEMPLKARNFYAGESTDASLSERFATLLRQEAELDAQDSAHPGATPDMDRATLQDALAALATDCGVYLGQTVELAPGIVGKLDWFEAEIFYPKDEHVAYLGITGRCVPLSAESALPTGPNALMPRKHPLGRFTLPPFNHVFWQVSAPVAVAA